MSSLCGNEKKTTEQFKKEVFEQVGNEYTVRSKYLGSHKDITMYHLSCGKEYTVKPYNFINNRRRCPHCFRNIRKTTQQFKEKVYELVGYEYKVLGEYQGTDEKSKCYTLHVEIFIMQLLIILFIGTNVVQNVSGTRKEQMRSS